MNNIKKVNMNKTKRNTLVYLITGIAMILFVSLFAGCENPITGFGPQPSFIDNNEHEPMLNVFGVLRPDTLENNPLSFVHLEAAFSVTSEYPDSFIIADADIDIYKYINNVVDDTIGFQYSDFDSLFPEHEYRPENFYPQGGETYGISCKREGYPELTSTTTMPFTPVIFENTLNISNNNISFTILNDSLSSLYDIHFYMGEKEYFSRVLSSGNGNIQIELPINRNTEEQGLLIIFAYDKNLSEYLTVTITLKLNTYQADYSTVDNGYGSFGSLNLLKKMVVF
ncbi:MAG: hypothetical protein KAR38_01165 [Calditrichia bacterium]|nr:hypothetical protein [Calditrichia bacterium]